jgi:MSHA biogenesis protein MshQ
MLKKILSLGALRAFGTVAVLFCIGSPAVAAFVEFNSSGGTSATDGLHFYIEDTTHLQIRRLNNTGQVYSPTATPPSTSLDNGVFLRANGKLYGPSHSVGAAFNPSGGMYNTFSITPTSPANPSSVGTQQVATNTLGITSGPQISIVWKYTTPLDFMTADVTLTIPAGYAVSAANPVRFYHVIDTYLGGSDSGCGLGFTDTNGKFVVGTYPPPTGTSCPSSTSIPAGVTIVESFRERSGQTFSSYCAAGWSTFFNNGGPNCSIAQTAALSNTIVTTYQDTGIGVAIDFTAAGTYTFSYDFVIGSTAVPKYDHLEIVHDGSATLCPENVTVRACTSSTVPCPSGSIVNTGTLTGNLTVTPSAPAVTVTPSNFSIGPTNYSPVMVLQGSGTGIYTLGISNISGTAPLNGIKCWNGSSASCTLTIANTPCASNFECLETGRAYNNLTAAPSTRNPLYTKLAGKDFKFDVVALQALGVPATTYTAAANVVVELFDDSASSKPACNAYSSPVASQAITFIASDLGRKTLPAFINLPNAYGKLICRVRDSNRTPNVYGCSSDDFSVRPLAPVLNTTASALAVSPLNTQPTVIKAGAPFVLGANTTPVAGYSGSLLQDISKLTAQKTTNNTTQQIGGTVGKLFAAGSVTNLAIATNSPLSNNASYSEVGYLYAAPGSFRDDSFTGIDLLPADCAKTNTCDCVTKTQPPTPDNGDAYLSDVLDSTNRYGCSIGNTTSVSFGRFIPDHFSVVTPATFNGFCTAGGFIYMDQPFTLSAVVEARNFADVVTTNYSDLFGLAAVTPQMLNAPATVLPNARLNYSVTAWLNGASTFSTDKFKRLATPDGPYDTLDMGLSLADADFVPLWNRNMDATKPSCTPDPIGTSSSAAGACKAAKVASTKMRYGRLKLTSVHGSELLGLPVPMRLEYWNGASGWNINQLDVCTNFSNTNFSLEFPIGTGAKPNNLAACETALTSPGVAPAQKILLSAPGTGNSGWTNLTLNLDTPSGNQCVALGGVGPLAIKAGTIGMPWLQYNWFGTGLVNPKVRATFGVYKNANEFIYLRELH